MGMRPNLCSFRVWIFTLSGFRTIFFPSRMERPLAKVHTIGKTEIRVYANASSAAPFHIINPDFEALIVIEDFSTYAGFPKGLCW